MLKNPCYDAKTHTDCKDRCTGCSTLCALWHDYVERRNELYDKRNKIIAEERAFIDHQEQLRERIRKRSHKGQRR